MPGTRLRTAYTLSWIIVALAVMASAGGAFIPNLYRDSFFVASQLVGNDVVTLSVAVPLLVGSLMVTQRSDLALRKWRAQLVWLGMLDYTLYNYAFYLFGTWFNVFFLLYAALFALSILALIFGLTGIDASAIGHSFRPKTPARWISGYMVFWALVLGGLWVAQSLAFVFTGAVPQVITDTNHPTSIVYALDLTLLVPFLLLAAIWLWRRQPWGYVLATILNVKGAIYALALVGMSISAGRAGISEAWSLLPIWLTFSIASLIAALILLRNLRPERVVA